MIVRVHIFENEDSANAALANLCANELPNGDSITNKYVHVHLVPDGSGRAFCRAYGKTTQYFGEAVDLDLPMQEVPSFMLTTTTTTI